MLGTDMMQPHKTRFPKVSSSSVKFRGPSITCADDQALALAGVISGSVAAAGAASAAGAGAAGEATSPSQKAVFFPVLETVWKTSSGLILPLTVTFCSFMSMSKDSTPDISKHQQQL
jgi:hypothetical protein